MRRITKEQCIEINAELLAIPYVADQLLDEIGIDDIRDVKTSQFRSVLALAKKFRDYACKLAELKKSRIQSTSRMSGRSCFWK